MALRCLKKHLSAQQAVLRVKVVHQTTASWITLSSQTLKARFKVVYDKVSSDDADVGFQALSIIGPKGPIKIIADQNCTPDVAYLLQMDTWTLNSLGPAPHILDLDGNRMLRIHNDDSYELRVGFYGNVACTAPGYNCRIALA